MRGRGASSKQEPNVYGGSAGDARTSCERQSPSVFQAVGIATRYGLDGPEIESRWRHDFPCPTRPALGPTQPPIQRVPGLSGGGKAAGAWR